MTAMLLAAGCTPPDTDDASDTALSDVSTDVVAGDTGADTPTDTPADVPGDTTTTLNGITSEVLLDAVQEVDGRQHPYQLVRVTDDVTGHVVYVQFSEPDGGVDAPTPTMVLTQPYAGIDWSGEEVDERWAALGPGIHPDVDGPDFVPGMGQSLNYEATTPTEAVGAGILYLFNGVNTLNIYGRFYAGGSIQNDVDDMTLGLRYLATRDDVDTDRIGISGGSWGGFEAIYAAAYAPEEVRPIIGVALFPLTDFEQEWAHVLNLDTIVDATDRASANRFFEPYLRRISATTGGSPADGDFGGFTHAELSETLQTPFMVFHDDHDMLVPFTMAEQLGSTLPSMVSHLWLRHEQPVDINTADLGHGLTISAHGAAITLLYVSSVLVQLSDRAELFVLSDDALLDALLRFLDEQESTGRSIGVAPQLLADIASERITVFVGNSGELVDGAAYIAEHVNAQWGTAFTIENVEASLRSWPGAE